MPITADLRSEVQIELTGNTLEGELIVPDNAKGIVVFAHGSGSSRHSPRNQFVARIIRESGNGTLLFDLLTHDEEIEDQFTGAFRFNIPLLARRLVETAKWLHSEAGRETYGLGFFGSSTGGGAALVAAARLGSQVDAVVSRGGRPDLALDALPKVQCPTLLLVGERDPVVIDLNEQAMERMRCPKELRIIPGATHLFEERGTLEQVAQAAADWFAQHLRRH
jgi:putative phosphoribosyl transferase